MSRVPNPDCENKRRNKLDEEARDSPTVEAKGEISWTRKQGRSNSRSKRKREVGKVHQICPDYGSKKKNESGILPRLREQKEK